MFAHMRTIKTLQIAGFLLSAIETGSFPLATAYTSCHLCGGFS